MREDETLNEYNIALTIFYHCVLIYFLLAVYIKKYYSPQYEKLFSYKD